LALVLGAGAGAVLGQRAEALRPLADLLLLLLKVLAVPAVVVSILHGLAGGSLRQLGGLGLRLVAAYGAIAFLATAIGAASAMLMLGGPRAGDARLARESGQPTGALVDGWWRPESLTLEHAIPLALVLSLALGLAIAAWRERDPAGPAVALQAGIRRLHAFVFRLLGVVLLYLPLGVFALVAIAFGQASAQTARAMATALAAVYAAQLVVAGLLVALAPLRARDFLSAVRGALVTAFATGSSAASLPVELQAAVRGLGRDPGAAGFALSLGASVCKAGTAAFLGALSLLAMAHSGQPVGWTDVGALVLVGTLAAVATPPVAGGGFVMLGFVVQQAGLPLDVAATLVAVPFVGKGNTPVNALGRLACAARLLPPAPTITSRVDAERDQSL
jgi:Na+/H+-dicarboxylate symporter